jgi:hypothetical protein
MPSPPTNGTIVTQVRRRSSAIDNTRPGWPNSSFDPVFNRNGGPSATEVLDGAADEGIQSIHGPHPSARPREIAELIGQATLSLGDGLQRVAAPATKMGVGVEDVGPLQGEERGPADTEYTGPDDQVAITIEVLPLPRRGGRRPGTERYPFGRLSLAREIDGRMEGESFLIPFEDHPVRRIAAGRKRHKPKRFITRKEDKGVRVWRDR